MTPHVQARFTGHKGPVYTLVEGPLPGTFLSGGGDGYVVQWDLNGPDHGEAIVQVGRPVFSLFHHERAGRLLIGTDSGGLHVVDLSARSEVQMLQYQQKGCYAVEVLRDGRVAVAGGDGTLAVYEDGPTLTLQRSIPVCEEKLRGLATSPDGTLLAIACGDGTVRLFDTMHFNEVHTLQAHEGGALSVAYHPGKPALLSGGKDGHIRVWHHEENYRALLAFPAHEAGIYRIAFDLLGGSFATCGRDKCAKLWSADDLSHLTRLDRSIGGHSHSVNALLWRGEALLTAGDDRKVLVWSLT